MSLQAFWESVEASPVGDFIASSSWAFPTIESIHVVAIVTVVGTVAIMDLRLLGWASPAWTARQMSNDTLRWTWVAFALAAVTGSLLFVSKAHIYAREPWFLWKLALIAVAGINMAIFEATTWKRVVGWDTDRKPPSAAILAGGLSLTLWVVVVILGRMIGFTLGQYE
jgi:hypothetical protein